MILSNILSKKIVPLSFLLGIPSWYFTYLAIGILDPLRYIQSGSNLSILDRVFLILAMFVVGIMLAAIREKIISPTDAPRLGLNVMQSLGVSLSKLQAIEAIASKVNAFTLHPKVNRIFAIRQSWRQRKNKLSGDQMTPGDKFDLIQAKLYGIGHRSTHVLAIQTPFPESDVEWEIEGPSGPTVKNYHRLTQNREKTLKKAVISFIGGFLILFAVFSIIAWRVTQ